MPTLSKNPSGQPMPLAVGSFSASQGAKSILLADDFTDSNLGNWEKWGPAPAGGGNGFYDQAQIRQYGSLLSLGCRENADGTYHSGGVGLVESQTGVRVEARVKINGTEGVDYCAILWPPSKAPAWPVGGEWDWIEVNGVWKPGPNSYQATYHSGANNDQNYFRPAIPNGRPGMEEWHTYGTTWRPGENVTLDIDGVWIGSLAGGYIVSTPQHLVFEVLQQGFPTQFSNMLIDWTVVYAI